MFRATWAAFMAHPAVKVVPMALLEFMEAPITRVAHRQDMVMAVIARAKRESRKKALVMTPGI
jgi:hypothetical protein